MTREERDNAIRCLKLWIEKEPYIQTYKTCLEALDQESCEDWYDVPSNEMNLEQARQGVKDLRKKLVEHLEQEPCEDAISRQVMLDYIYNDLGLGDEENGKDLERQMDLVVSYKYVKSLPPVNPQPKTGHWIIIDDCEKFIAKCSECGQIEDSRMIDTYAYCHCGAKMEGEQNG